MNEFGDRYNFGPVYKYPFLFEKEDFPLQFDLASTRIRFCLKREICPSALVVRPHASLFFQKEIFPSGLIFRPHVSVFVLRGRFFPSVWSFIHTYSFLFEKVDFFFRFGLSYTRIRFCLNRETFRPVFLTVHPPIR